MSTAPANAATAAAYVPPAGLERLAGSGELSLGQIIKARVLRHEQGSRYLVLMEGRERVVDSTIPLKTGELIRGRVLAVGDRVEVQPLPDAEFQAQAEPAPAAGGPKSVEDELAAAFAKAGIPLDAPAREALARSLRNPETQPVMFQAALALAKLGLPPRPVLLEELQSLLARQPLCAADAVEPAQALPVPSPEKLPQLIQGALAAPHTGTSAMSADARNAGGDSGGNLGRWVLNAQTGGSVFHRVGTLPLLIGGRLVEVDVALFEQDARQPRQGESRSRRLVFALNAGELGKVEVSARLVNAHVRLRFAAERSATLEMLASRREALSAQLAELGWVIDEIEYEVKPGEGTNPAYGAVVEHLITQGSLDQKI